MAAKLGSMHRIGDDGWWHVAESVPILVTDQIRVIDLDEAYVFVDVLRDGTSLGTKKIHHRFFDVDFEPDTDDQQ